MHGAMLRPKRTSHGAKSSLRSLSRSVKSAYLPPPPPQHPCCYLRTRTQDLDAKCAEVGDDHVAGKACEAYETVRKLVNATVFVPGQVVGKITEYCSGTPAHGLVCETVAYEIHEVWDAICDQTNSTAGDLACEYLPVVVEDAEEVWLAIKAYCKAGVCEAIQLLENAVEDQAIRHAVQAHCNRSLARREETCLGGLVDLKRSQRE